MAPSPDETEQRAQMPSVTRPQPTAADLQKLLDSDADGPPVTINPDGTISPAGEAPAPVEVKSPHKNWSIKDGQEVVDKHTGLHLRFGSYGDNSNTVFLIATLAGPEASGVTIVFQREGEPTRLLPHVVGKAAAEALDENVEVGAEPPPETLTGAERLSPPVDPPRTFTPIS